MNIFVGLISFYICVFICSFKIYILVVFNVVVDIFMIWYRFEGQSFNKNYRSGYLYLFINVGLWVFSFDVMKLF